jgi:chemotaxis protein CheX
MRMELIQPFINAADAVLGQGLKTPTSIGNLSMENEVYLRKGIAALVWVTGDIEGRIIFDMDSETAVGIANRFLDTEPPESNELVREAVCEMANQVTGNAIATLNDQGFHFRVHPPTTLTAEQGSKGTEDTEALVLCFETSLGSVFMNIALRYNLAKIQSRNGQPAANAINGCANPAPAIEGLSAGAAAGNKSK